MSGCLILLAPSKTMDFETPTPFSLCSERPEFITKAALLSARISAYSVPKIMTIMGVSRTIAESVAGCYAEWNQQAAGKPALWTYKGDVYKGLRAVTMTKSDADWAQQHLLIASGLYGLLRPYDGVQRYRLEMSSKIAVDNTKNLYDFWGDSLVNFIYASGADWLCCLSSDEYARPVTAKLALPVVTPVFLDHKPNGTIGTVPIYSKIMRGVMARWIIDNRIVTPDQLNKFAGHGYLHDALHSTADKPAYSREIMMPLRF